jgi:hypothetical protein
MTRIEQDIKDLAEKGYSVLFSWEFIAFVATISDAREITLSSGAHGESAGDALSIAIQNLPTNEPSREPPAGDAPAGPLYWDAAGRPHRRLA